MSESVGDKVIKAVLALAVVGLAFIVVGVLLRDWMTWCTGAGIIRVAMWLGED